MSRARHLTLAAALGVAACGGGNSSTPTAGVPQNAFTGTITISSAMPAGTTNCLATSPVVISATGAAPHTVTVAGGDCVAFQNTDTAAHHIISNSVGGCAELSALAAVAGGNTITTAPLGGPKACNWEDAFNPPPVGGGGGGGGGY
jgi:plastocyanin